MLTSLLAQVLDPQTVEAIGKAAAAAGADRAAELAPTHWIQAVITGVGFVIFAIVVGIFTRERKGDRDERVQSQQQCHDHSERMMTMTQSISEKCATAATACAVALSVNSKGQP